ncbi:hypothetical protein Gohar_027163 [Gossypium harknessii]|uniref:Uncharacterized protein n=1 Tax=Gossypium harknessii TaxID=34285 RepID=A0A7J9HWK3_9ROSI|nr:hypothetical protein [Gossypium harknessii]
MKTILLVCMMINGSGWWSDGEHHKLRRKNPEQKCIMHTPLVT